MNEWLKFMNLNTKTCLRGEFDYFYQAIEKSVFQYSDTCYIIDPACTFWFWEQRKNYSLHI